MGKRETEHQEPLWVAASKLPQAPGHPFYQRLNGVLAEAGFDRFAEELCAPYYAEVMGRPSIPPGVYFRMLMVGYFEGIDSERGIAWLCGDSRGLGRFLGYAPTELTPDHSTVSRTRRLIALETHQEVFAWVLKVLQEKGLLKGSTVGVDATTLEANAAMRSIVRRDTKESYEEFLTRLAKASGIETPTRQDLARIDRERKGKASNEDWEHPHDPDAKIAKMKDGRTHMAYKAEHVVDMETGAVVAVTVQAADQGDTETMLETVAEAAQNLEQVREAQEDKHAEAPQRIEEVVADKGYHSNDTMRDLGELEIRSYVSEPDRGRRVWEGKEREREAVYANRRRIRGRRGRELMRKRGEFLERSFAHAYETGGMRRVHLRGRANIWKRALIHVAALNLGLVMRAIVGVGTPRGMGAAPRAVLLACGGLVQEAVDGLKRTFWFLWEMTDTVGDPTHEWRLARPPRARAPCGA
jgi:transposase